MFSHANSQPQFHDHELEALLKIKQYLQNPPSLSHWTPSNSSHCSWPEITCTNGSVTGIALVNANINKAIPPFICDLTNLTHVDFSQNFIPGEFPTSLYNCSKLEFLDLYMNNFVGKIPDDIDRLANLRYLNLASTNFTGDIPASIGRLKKLRVLRLQYCLFDGTVPDEIGNLSNLEFLDLSTNMMLPPTRLPSSWTKLNKLKVLYMYSCNLVGEIPGTIGEMVALEKLDLSQNGLTGQIPSGLLMLKSLSILYLWLNRFSGGIPAVVEALNLTTIDLADNSLTGKIPGSLGRLPSLVDFSVFSNNLSGTLPPDFGRYSKLGFFRVGSNNFRGRLPENLCYYGELITLTVAENNLNGELPESLGNCSSLQVLGISRNEFSGNIPSGLWTSSKLVSFVVSHNKFTGELPERLSSSVLLFDVSYNQFSGKIPAGVLSWTNVVVFHASRNYLNGSIPHELTALPNLKTLLLDQNQLIGPLPSDILSWESLATLDLSKNQLSGQIPDAIGRLPDLVQLDLSENQFSGQVPSQFPRLTNLNLSSNHLTGRIPSEFEISVYGSSFLDNPSLCADTPALNLTLCGSGSSSKDSSWLPALIISLVVVVSLFAILMSILIVRLNRKRKQVVDNEWKLIAFQRLSFTESDIMSSMIEHNIVGSGGYGTVYRVAIDGLGYVAVKRICDKRKLSQNLESSFLTEVKILSNIRHKNIVKLLCCFHNDDSMHLVYEYLENRSLDEWLPKRSGSFSVSGSVHHVALNWPKRMQIAIGVAQGLSYMHHDCSPPVIHRDVKTSNILLDSEFNAKVADFGLARMLIKPGDHVTMSVVVGSFGYLAPEYVQTTRISEKIDVFSFGVILLELTTGKAANYGDEHSSLAQWAWRHFQEGSNIEELLDKEVAEPGYTDEMCHVFKLGVMCTATHPATRPTMKKAMQILLYLGESFAHGEGNVGH